MKRLRKVILYFCFITICLFVVFCTVVYIFRDDIKNLAIKEINSNVTSEITVSNISISLFKQFPRMSIVLNNVKIPSSIPNPNGEKHLIYAEKIFFSLNSIELLKGKVDISEILITEGIVNVIIDRKNNNNFDILKHSTNNNNTNRLNIKTIKFSNSKLSFLDQRKAIFVKTKIDNAKITVRNNVIFDINTSQQIEQFKLRNFSISDIDLVVKSRLQLSENNLKTNSSLIEINGIKITPTLTINKENSKWFSDITIKVANAEIKKILKIIPKKHIVNIADYDLKGKINLGFNYHGEIEKINDFIINYSNSGEIKANYSGKNITVNNLSGNYNNNTSLLKIDSINYKINESSIYANGSYNNNSGQIAGSIKGVISMKDLASFKQIDYIKDLSGKVDIECSFELNTKTYGDNLINSLDIKNSSFIRLSDISFESSNSKYRVHEINGKVIYGDICKIESLSLKIRENDFLFDGTITNLMDYLRTNNSPLLITADLKSKNIQLDNWLNTNNNKEKNQNNVISFPDRINLNLELNIENFKYKNFSANNIIGRFNYKPRMITLSSLRMNSMDGELLGGGIIIQKYNHDFAVSSQANLKKIDINKLFKSFNDFGQQTISYTNLYGEFTGDINFSSEWDKNLTSKTEKINTIVDAEITNCTLYKYEPIYKLKDYFNVKDLSEVKFELIKNKFTIKDRVLSFPKMDIISSTADISISGTHNFDNNFDYRMSIRLADVIKGKKKRVSQQNTEWGIIESDGAGETTVFLKIIGNPQNYKISYDSKSAFSKTKKTFINQGQELKSVFNKEFGKDTIKKKKKFTIEWEEDSI